MRDRRNFGTLRRYPLGGSGGGGAEPIDPRFVVDTVAATGGSFRFAGSISHRISSTDTGPLFLMHRVSDDATQAATYDVATNRLDEAAVIAFGAATASNVNVRTIYDKSGNGLDLPMATEGSQLKIYDHATGAIMRRGMIPSTWSNGGVERVERAAALGLSGVTAVTIAHYSARDSYLQSDTGVAVVMGLGAATSGQMVDVALNVGGPQTRLYNEAAARQFTPLRKVDLASGYVHVIGAGQQIGASVCYQNGTSLAQLLVSGGTTTLNLGTTRTVIGSSVFQIAGLEGGQAAWFISGEEFTGAKLDALNAFFAAVDTDKVTGVSAHLEAIGQSNANQMQLAPFERAGYSAGRTAQNGVSITSWATGGALFVAAAAALNAANASAALHVWLLLGESDGSGDASSTAYAGLLATLVTDMNAAVSRPIHWHFSTFDAAASFGNATWRGRIDTAHTNQAASMGASATLHDTNSVPGTLTDGFHYDGPLQANTAALVLAAMP